MNELPPDAKKALWTLAGEGVRRGWQWMRRQSRRHFERRVPYIGEAVNIGEDCEKCVAEAVKLLRQALYGKDVNDDVIMRGNLFLLNFNIEKAWSPGTLVPLKGAQVGFDGSTDKSTSWSVHEDSAASESYRESRTIPHLYPELAMRAEDASTVDKSVRWVLATCIRSQKTKSPIAVLCLDGRDDKITEADLNRAKSNIKTCKDDLAKLLDSLPSQTIYVGVDN